jgi:hypothetical protein
MPGVAASPLDLLSDTLVSLSCSPSERSGDGHRRKSGQRRLVFARHERAAALVASRSVDLTLQARPWRTDRVERA